MQRWLPTVRRSYLFGAALVASESEMWYNMARHSCDCIDGDSHAWLLAAGQVPWAAFQPPLPLSPEGRDSGGAA